MQEEGALVLYGRGAGLGNFKFFADDLVTTELTSIKRQNIFIKKVGAAKIFSSY